VKFKAKFTEIWKISPKKGEIARSWQQAPTESCNSVGEREIFQEESNICLS